MTSRFHFFAYVSALVFCAKSLKVRIPRPILFLWYLDHSQVENLSNSSRARAGYVDAIGNSGRFAIQELRLFALRHIRGSSQFSKKY